MLIEIPTQYGDTHTEQKMLQINPIESPKIKAIDGPLLLITSFFLGSYL